MTSHNLLSDQGLRLDGRRPNELRKICCKLGVFSQPDGSAYLEQGNTKVLAAVYGPHQVRINCLELRFLFLHLFIQYFDSKCRLQQRKVIKMKLLSIVNTVWQLFQLVNEKIDQEEIENQQK